jgi:hypothetical protein
VVYATPISSKQESKSLFQNLTANIAKVQILKGIVLLGGDFNVHITMLPNTINISDLYELLQVLEFAEIEQPSVVAKLQNRDASVGDWGYEFLDLCYDAGLFIINGQTPGDESMEFTCLSNGGCNTINYIVGSPVV